MGSLSDHAEAALLDHLFNSAYTPAATVFMGFAGSAVGEGVLGSTFGELADENGYARAAITFTHTTARIVEQDADVTFAETTGDFVSNPSHWVILDSGNYGEGNVLAQGAFNSAFAVVAGNETVIASGEANIEYSATSGGAGLTDYAVSALLDKMFRNQAFARPDTYLGLAVFVIDDQDVAFADITETSGTAYARVLIDQNGGVNPTWDFASGSVVSNTHNVSFAAVGASNWTSFNGAFIIDTTTGAGNVIAYDSSNVTAQEPSVTDIVRIQAGGFTIAMT